MSDHCFFRNIAIICLLREGRAMRVQRFGSSKILQKKERKLILTSPISDHAITIPYREIILSSGVKKHVGLASLVPPR